MPATHAPSPPWPRLAAFALVAAAIVGTGALVSARLSALPSPNALALGVSLDLVLVLPLAYYVLLARGAGWPPMLAFPLGLGGLALAAFLLPEAHPGAVPLLLRALPVAEVAIATLVLIRAARTLLSVRDDTRGADVADLPRHLRAAFGKLLPLRYAGDAVASEAAVFYYATAGWRRAAPGALAFGYAKDTAALYGAFALALAAETVALHVLLHLFVGPALAWVMTALSVYSLVWLLADARAVQHRPITFGADTSAPLLHLRSGLRWEADMPLAGAQLFRLPRKGALPKEGGALDITLLRRATHLVEVPEPVELLGPVGIRRKARRILFAVDEPEAFEAAFREVMAR